MARPRNNIMKLTVETRLRICELLDDGATYDDICDDELVAAECAEKELALHGTTFLAYGNGAEFDEYRARRREWSDDMQRNKIAATLVESGDAPDDIARLVNYKMLQSCLNKLNSGEDLTDKELRAVSGAITGYNRNRIAEEKEDTRREAAEKEAEYQTKIAELAAIVAEQTEKISKLSAKAGSASASAVIDEMDKFARGG